MRPVFLGPIAVTLFAFLASELAAQSSTRPRSITGWSVSCGVDKGALTKNRRDYTFRPSSNHCNPELVGTIGQWGQRTELSTKPYSVKLKGRYVFQTKVSFTSASKQKFDIFQMHDGRNACAPPLKVKWNSNNQIRLDSHYKVAGKGEKHCIKNNITTANLQRGATLRRDGTEYELMVILNFDGSGAFKVAVAIDGMRVVDGAYDPVLAPGIVRSVYNIAMNSPKIDSSKYYAFKHGVYSNKPFDFVLHSRGMKMARAK